MIRRPPTPTLFPYTTLFRSAAESRRWTAAESRSARRGEPIGPRSEEHTSELQSPDHLVCRLLLEKKTLSAQSPHPNALVSCASIMGTSSPRSFLIVSAIGESFPSAFSTSSIQSLFFFKISGPPRKSPLSPSPPSSS